MPAFEAHQQEKPRQAASSDARDSRPQGWHQLHGIERRRVIAGDGQRRPHGEDVEHTVQSDRMPRRPRGT